MCKKENIRIYDTIVIGGGLLGCFCALNLSRYSVDTALLEMREDICTGISRANTAVIYPGYDNHPDSMKTKLTVKANQSIKNLCRVLGVSLSRCGSLMVSTGPNGDKTIQKKYKQGIANNVPGLKLLSQEEVLKLEPSLTPAVTSGLYASTTATLHPWELCIAAFEAAKELGCSMHLNTKVTGIRKENNCFRIESGNGNVFYSRCVVNCAGIHADQVHALYQKPVIRIRAELAEYLVFDPETNPGLHHIIFHETEEKGKGVTLVPTINGKILAGTTYHPANTDMPLVTSEQGRQELMDGCASLLPSLKNYTRIRSFSGLRPNPFCPDHPDMNIRDFPPLITDTEDGMISLTAVKTPGLTCCNELGNVLTQKVLDFLKIPQNKKKEIPHRQNFKQEYNRPEYQKIVCRCENITEGDILDAIQRGATTIDGVKRRTGSGMGICQGNHCSARIAELLSEWLHVPMEEITKDGANSYYLYHSTGESLHD